MSLLDELAAIEERLAAEPLEERKATVGLDPKRAGVIVAGFVILEEVLALAGADAYTASESDILHGMIFEGTRRLGREDCVVKAGRGGGTRTHNPKRRILSPLRMPIPPRPRVSCAVR